LFELTNFYSKSDVSIINVFANITCVYNSLSLLITIVLLFPNFQRPYPIRATLAAVPVDLIGRWWRSDPRGLKAYIPLYFEELSFYFHTPCFDGSAKVGEFLFSSKFF
jgi:hypothetical protein